MEQDSPIVGIGSNFGVSRMSVCWQLELRVFHGSSTKLGRKPEFALPKARDSVPKLSPELIYLWPFDGSVMLKIPVFELLKLARARLRCGEQLVVDPFGPSLLAI